MASINQLVSEFAHSLGQPNNAALRENLKLLVIQTRNELVRHSYEKHGYVDKILTQRFEVTLIDVNDGDVKLPEGVELDIAKIKRTSQKVPRPLRLTNNLPFDRISSVGFQTSRVFPYIKETSARFRNSVPGLTGMICYDYINEYIYLFPTNCNSIKLDKIVIESAFEHPNEIAVLQGEDEMTIAMDNNEWLLSEDMIGQIKELIYKRDLLATIRETNQIPNEVKFNQ
jgi:hypothetical protein